ncbi:MAG: SDR family oxidoreductase [Chloroflexi bacterium]|nr:SDR family oxidoreductase [Chloroflexota bacterium]
MTDPAHKAEDVQTVMITGAAAGIGAGVAAGFANLGANLVLADIDEEELASLDNNLTARGVDVLASRTDVTSAAGLKALVNAAVERFSGIDVLVVAAGGFSGSKTIEEVSDEEWEAGVALNLSSAFKTARAVVPVMKRARAGRIIMISSASGRMPTNVAAGVCYYAASKAGLLGLTRVLAIELGPYGVTVNAVAPGTTYTERVAKFRSLETFDRIAETVPLGRISTVEEQVGPILFLASPPARYITGATLDVNGGRLML